MKFVGTLSPCHRVTSSSPRAARPLPVPPFVIDDAGVEEGKGIILGLVVDQLAGGGDIHALEAIVRDGLQDRKGQIFYFQTLGEKVT